MNREVLLVRHAKPIIVPDRPAGWWRLGAEGRAQAADLSEEILRLAPDLIVASTERKAIDTGDIIAARLHLSCASIDGFHEQGADSVPFIDDPGDFREAVRQHFAQSDRTLLGNESSRDAARRFRTALDVVGDRFPLARLPLVVSHGRIMASFLGDLNGQDPWEIWKELRLPDLIRVDLDARRFEQLY